MRTRLLRTVYPSAAAAEPDTGCAANDACYAAHDTAKPPPAPPASKAHAEDDDYVLGGYAGI
jgi:hypothetical protein